MKININGLLIVEGILDESYLSSFLEVEIVKTSGYQIPKEEIEYLKSSNKNLIILTDSDEAGETIRNRLNKLLGTANNVRVDITKCNKNNKHGVAEAPKEEILRVLKDYVINTPLIKGNLTTFDLLELGITGPNSKSNKELIIKTFKLGLSNSKTLLKRLNYRNITKEQLIEVINGNK